MRIAAKCLDDRKRRFPTWQDAERARDLLLRTGVPWGDRLGELRVYWCVDHVAYHLGHDRRAVKPAHWSRR